MSGYDYHDRLCMRGDYITWNRVGPGCPRGGAMGLMWWYLLMLSYLSKVMLARMMSLHCPVRAVAVPPSVNCDGGYGLLSSCISIISLLYFQFSDAVHG